MKLIRSQLAMASAILSASSTLRAVSSAGQLGGGVGAFAGCHHVGAAVV
jgi:hypothetical protein